MSHTTIREATEDDAADVGRIYNQGIEDRGATFETEPRTLADMAARLAERGRFPVLVAEEADAVVGWAGLSSYRSRPCYAGIAEFSIYLDRRARRRGIGKDLLTALIAAARDRGYWKLVSRVFPSNAASRAVCRACGFREVGVYEKHAPLDGTWMDVVIVERLIGENMTPPSTRTAAGNVQGSL
jgi:phosphinothricin acetyltransferase